jgi:hypothetical protein
MHVLLINIVLSNMYSPIKKFKFICCIKYEVFTTMQIHMVDFSAMTPCGFGMWIQTFRRNIGSERNAYKPYTVLRIQKTTI